MNAFDRFECKYSFEVEDCSNNEEIKTIKKDE